MAGIEPASSGSQTRRAAIALHPVSIRIRESNPVMWVTKPLLFPMSYSGEPRACTRANGEELVFSRLISSAVAGDRGVEPRPAGFGGPPEPSSSPSGSGGMESNHLHTGHESAASPFGLLQWGDQPDSHRYLRVHTPAPSSWTMATVRTGGIEPPTSCISDRCADHCATFVCLCRLADSALCRIRTCALRLRTPVLSFR